ncbi:hypothetical protein PVAP13_5KG190207 [Panicum virgatum]|uniref:Secreted protein n=1 Tax=Panicum virgatum TaxID=38727 RepID=A0A8T0SKU9_PANVG|nr:hypothetical protein PVAP13_5KG190207 [Panicum virgatum]
MPLWFLERAALTHLARASVAHGPCATPGLTPTLPALPRLRPRTPVRRTRKHDITRKYHVLWPPSICPTQYLFGRMEAKDEAGGRGGQISNRDRPQKQG